MKKRVLSITLLLIIFGFILYQSPTLRNAVYSGLPQGIIQKIEHFYPKIFHDKTRPLYKWKNNNGQWIVSDTPPKKGIDYEILQYHPDTNVIPAESINRQTDNK